MPTLVTVLDNPIIQDSLTHLRKEITNLEKFRHHSDKICHLLFAEAMQGLDLKTVEVKTPLTKTTAHKLADEIVIVPVLRAGLAMLFGAMRLLPKAKIGFVGMERDEKTAQASEYYWKLPPINQSSVVIVTDPMLATGGSIGHLLHKVSQQNPKEIRVVSVVSAPEGIKALQTKYPQVKIFTGAIDEKLNKTAFIVPGLGDYGDRYFGTE